MKGPGSVGASTAPSSASKCGSHCSVLRSAMASRSGVWGGSRQPMSRRQSLWSCASSSSTLAAVPPLTRSRGSTIGRPVSATAMLTLAQGSFACWRSWCAAHSVARSKGSAS